MPHNITNEQLVHCVELSTLKEVLGTKKRSEAVKRLNAEPIAKQDTLRASLVKSSKKRKIKLLAGESTIDGEHVPHATNYLPAVAELFKTGTEQADILSKTSLADLAYAQSHFLNNQKQVTLSRITKRSTDEPIVLPKAFDGTFIAHLKSLASTPTHDRILLALSEFGAPVGMPSETPQPRVIRVEDQNHLFLSFELLGEQQTVYDHLEGEYKEYTPRHEIICRLHLDSHTLEMQGGAKEKDIRESCFAYIAAFFTIPIGYRKMPTINQDTFKKFGARLRKYSHQKHDGLNAVVSMTRSHAKADTRKDKKMQHTMKNRSFRELQGQLRVNGLPSVVTVGVKRDGLLSLKGEKLTPVQRRKVLHSVYATLWP